MFVMLLSGTTCPFSSWLNSVLVSQKVAVHQSISGRESICKPGSFLVCQNTDTLIGNVSI